LYNGKRLDNKLNETLESINGNLSSVYLLIVVNGRKNDYNYEIVSTIKENIFSSVFKARKKINSNNIPLLPNIISNYDPRINNEFVAIKKIYKDKIKEEMKFALCKDEITEEDFKPEIAKFNKELENMQKCQCEYSVHIFDYYDKEKEFTIIMELCDETLFHVLCRKQNGFSSKEIQKILLQLNEVFKRMNYYNISHRDIKLNNILIKYLNKEKTKFKVLLSDYGISNQLYSLTQKFNTHAGSQLIMAPEILNDEKYNSKCDLWSLGIIIYQLYTKNFPYRGTVEKAILNQIKQKGLSVLNAIDPKDKNLKDLLSKLLVSNPEQRISWEE
jgi:serine/threonine protein kinase